MFWTRAGKSSAAHSGCRTGPMSAMPTRRRPFVSLRYISATPSRQVRQDGLVAIPRRYYELPSLCQCMDPHACRPRFNIVGGKPKLSAKPGAWSLASDGAGLASQHWGPQPGKYVVVEMLAPKQEGDGLQGWVVTATYSLFGIALALCSLLSVPSASRVCTADCPLPMCSAAAEWRNGWSCRAGVMSLCLHVGDAPGVCHLPNGAR